MKELLTHPFEPVYSGQSRILILGSFPSVKSRLNGFYYGHPQNRFWPLMALLLNEALPQSNQEKEAFLLRSGIALWDVYQSCEISGSADSSIEHGKANDIPALLQKTKIKKVYLNGRAAQQALKKAYPDLETQSTYLPSTSPANAAWRIDKLAAHWQCILEDLF